MGAGGRLYTKYTHLPGIMPLEHGQGRGRKGAMDPWGLRIPGLSASTPTHARGLGPY